MSSEILVAVIAATPPTIGAVLGYIASKRSLKRSIGANPSMPLRQVLAQMEARFETRFDRLESKIDFTSDEHAGFRERLARLEVERVWPEGRRR